MSCGCRLCPTRSSSCQSRSASPSWRAGTRGDAPPPAGRRLPRRPVTAPAVLADRAVGAGYRGPRCGHAGQPRLPRQCRTLPSARAALRPHGHPRYRSGHCRPTGVAHHPAQIAALGTPAVGRRVCQRPARHPRHGTRGEPEPVRIRQAHHAATGGACTRRGRLRSCVRHGTVDPPVACDDDDRRYPNDLRYDWRYPEESDGPTLAELLRDRGYLTGASSPTCSTRRKSRESGAVSSTTATIPCRGDR